MATEVINTMADNNYDKAINKSVQRLLVEAGLIIQGAAELNAPVDTGRLAGSITYATRGKRSRVRGEAKGSDAVTPPSQNDEVHIGTNVEYALDVEYGTKAHSINGPVKIRGVGWRYIGKHPGTKKQPFMRPALDDNRTRIVRELGLEIHKGLEDGK